MTGLLPKAPAAPTIPAPAVMPTPDDTAIQAAKQQQTAALLARSGRQSTILSDNSGKSDKFG